MQGEKKEYVIIVGASFNNSGAESMTCIVANEIHAKMPQYKIVLATSDTGISERNVNAKILSYGFPTKIEGDHSVDGFLFHLLLHESENQKKYHDILSKTKYIFDISGYSFTTKFGIKVIYQYLYKIHIASTFHIPYYILPQSFGPVEKIGFFDRLLFSYFTSKYMKYPKVVYAREKSGYIFLKPYCTHNLKYSPDMVLLYDKKITREIIGKPVNKEIFEWHDSKDRVAVIPNEKILTKTKNGKKYLDLLKNSADYLVKQGYEVHIICHCGRDRKICSDLYRLCEEKDGIILHKNQIDSESFTEIVNHFQFVIASRYHSVIHSYRAHVPAIVFGWEDKYNDLLSLMKQRKYLFDMRNDIQIENVYDTIQLMKERHFDESNILNDRLLRLRDKYGKHQCSIGE